MIRKLSATPTAMGTKKLKSESKKHSSADRHKKRQRGNRQQVSVLVSRKQGFRIFTVHKGIEKEAEQQGSRLKPTKSGIKIKNVV